MDVSLLYERWAAYCAGLARAGADVTVLAMDREFPDPARVRAWTRCEMAPQRSGTLIEQLASPCPQLVAVIGWDLSAGLLPATACPPSRRSIRSGRRWPPDAPRPRVLPVVGAQGVRRYTAAAANCSQGDGLGPLGELVVVDPRARVSTRCRSGRRRRAW